MNNRPNTATDSPITQIAGDARKKGMSTRDILKALCALNKVTHQLSDMAAVISVDMRAAKLNQDLQQIEQTSDKAINNARQHIQEGIDLVGNNQGTKQFHEGFNRQASQLIQQFETANNKKDEARAKCKTLTHELQQEIHEYLSNESARANKAAFFNKIKPIQKQLIDLDKNITQLAQTHQQLEHHFSALKINIDRVANTLKTGGPAPSELRPE